MSKLQARMPTLKKTISKQQLLIFPNYNIEKQLLVETIQDRMPNTERDPLEMASAISAVKKLLEVQTRKMDL